jgi:hypothetical protein
MGVTLTGRRAKSYTKHRRKRDLNRLKDGPPAEIETRWVPPVELRAAQLEQLLRQDPEALDRLPEDLRGMLRAMLARAR